MDGQAFFFDPRIKKNIFDAGNGIVSGFSGGGF